MKKKAVAPKKKAVKKPAATLGIPADVTAAMLNAVGTGKYLIAVWSVADDKVNLFRSAVNFPKADLDIAAALLAAHIQELKQ